MHKEIVHSPINNLNTIEEANTLLNVIRILRNGTVFATIPGFIHYFSRLILRRIRFTLGNVTSQLRLNKPLHIFSALQVVKFLYS